MISINNFSIENENFFTNDEIIGEITDFQDIKVNGFYNLSGIYIDDNDPSYNWDTYH